MGDSVSAIDMQFKMLDNLYETIEKDVKEMNNENKDDVIVSVGKFILSCYQLKTQVYVSHMRHENDELFTDHIEKIDELIKKGIQCHQMVVDYKEEKEKFSKEFTDAVLKYLCDADDKQDPSELLARLLSSKKRKYYGRKLEDDDKQDQSELIARYLNSKKKYYGIRSEDDDNTPYDHFMETMGELETVAKENGIHRHKDFSKSEQDRERMYMTMEYKDGSKLIMYKDGSGKEEKPLKMATIVFDDDSYEDISLPKELQHLKKLIEKWIHSDVKTLREYLPSNWRFGM